MWKSACIYFVFVKYMSFYTITRIVWKAIHKTLVIISEQWDEGGRNFFIFTFYNLCFVCCWKFFFRQVRRLSELPRAMWVPHCCKVNHVCLWEANSLFYRVALDSGPSSPTDILTREDPTFLWRPSHCPCLYICRQHRGN